MTERSSVSSSIWPRTWLCISPVEDRPPAGPLALGVVHRDVGVAHQLERGHRRGADRDPDAGADEQLAIEDLETAPASAPWMRSAMSVACVGESRFSSRTVTVAAEPGDEPVGTAAPATVSSGRRPSVRRRRPTISSSSPTAWLKLSLMRLEAVEVEEHDRAARDRELARRAVQGGARRTPRTALGWAGRSARRAARCGAASSSAALRMVMSDVEPAIRAGSPLPVADRHAARQKPAVARRHGGACGARSRRRPRPLAGALRRPPSGPRRRRDAARSTVEIVVDLVGGMAEQGLPAWEK